MDHGLELVLGEVPVEHLGSYLVVDGLLPRDARAKDPPLRHGEAHGGRDGAHGVHGKGGAAHHGRVQLHGDDDEPVICRCDVGIEGEPLHDRRAVDDGDVEVARRILERELQGLLVEQKLVLVYEVDDGGDDVYAALFVREHGVRDCRLPVEKPDRPPARLLRLVVEPEEVGGGCLRVEVNEQHPRTLRRIHVR